MAAVMLVLVLSTPPRHMLFSMSVVLATGEVACILLHGMEYMVYIPIMDAIDTYSVLPCST